MFVDLKKFWLRERCDCCREWIELGFGNRVFGEGKTYHWDCYWKIIWPQKVKASSRKLKAQSK
jgi:hypothetical protein